MNHQELSWAIHKYKYTSITTHIHKFTSKQVHKYTNTQISKYISKKECKYARMQAHSWFATVVDGNELGQVYPFQLKQLNP